MTITDALSSRFGSLVSLEKLDQSVFRIYAPFFHEDGDMISMYLEQLPDGSFRIRDYGNTLMRISYTFDLGSENKRSVLNNIVRSGNGLLENSELQLMTTQEMLPEAILQFSQLVAKVSSIELLQRQTVKSLFYEYLSDYISSELSGYQISRNYTPTRDKQLIVDYQIKSSTSARPLFLFGVNEDAKATKVIISCLNFQNQRIPFRSLAIHEDFDSLTSFNRNQITNAVDKQFTSIDEFRTTGADYIGRELAS